MMFHASARPSAPRFAGGCLILVALALALGGCVDFSSALPPSPSPFPTLARLPTVTPVPPTPIPSPTLVPSPAPPSPTPVPLFAVVTAGANVREGPGTDFAIVAVVGEGERVMLSGQADDWYRVVTPSGAAGWMFAQVLEVDPTTAEAVPIVEP